MRTYKEKNKVKNPDAPIVIAHKVDVPLHAELHIEITEQGIKRDLNYSKHPDMIGKMMCEIKKAEFMLIDSSFELEEGATTDTGDDNDTD